MDALLLYSLQSAGLSAFKIQPNPAHAVIFLAGLAALVALVIFLTKSKKVNNSAIFKSGTINKIELRNPETKNLKKAALKYGLERDELKFLLNMFRQEEIDSSIFSSIENIDAGFSKINQALCREEDTDDDIKKLFSIRNKIEYYFSADEAAHDGEGDTTVRRYKRADVNIPAAFYLVIEKEVQSGAKTVKKLSLDSTKYTGNIIDISSGGCAINTGKSYKAGTRIKIEFKIGRNSLSALAQILRINQNQSESILHARFLKVPVKTLNAINTFVFNYRTI
jgi:hypothetical protein